MITIKEIARLANLSISTVSKVINNKSEDLSEETINKVMNLVKKYNYVPYGIQKDKGKKSKSYTIALVLRDLNIPKSFLDTMTKTFNDEGYSLLLYNSDNNEDYERSNLFKLSSKNIDALIWEPLNSFKKTNKRDSEKSIYKEVVNNDSFKTILINDNNKKVATFSIDYFKIAYDLAQKIIDSGYKKIDCYYLDNDSRSKNMLSGFKSCIIDNDIKLFRTFPINLNTEKNLKLNFYDGSAILTSHLSIAKKIRKEIKDRYNKSFLDVSISSIVKEYKNEYSEFNLSYAEIPYKEFSYFLSKTIINYVEHNKLKFNSFKNTTRFYDLEKMKLPIKHKSPSILIIGSINLDHIVFLENFPKSGTVQIAKKNIKLAGGKALNQAIGLKNLNKDVMLIGKIGTDESGDIIINTLENEGISTDLILRDSNTSTGVATVLLKDTGESSIFLSGQGNSEFSVKELNKHENQFSKSSYVLIQTEVPIDIVERSLVLAKKYNSFTILKPAALSSFDNKLYKYIDIIIPNKTEAYNLTKKHKVEEQARYLLDKGVKIVVVTLGKEGVYLMTKDTSKFFKSYSTSVVDETGASDAFISAFTSMLYDNFSLEEAIRAGIISSSFTISRFGVSNSLIDFNTLEKYRTLYF